MEWSICYCRFKDGEWSKKWWMTFLKRDFMNLEISLLCFVCCRNELGEDEEYVACVSASELISV